MGKGLADTMQHRLPPLRGILIMLAALLALVIAAWIDGGKEPVRKITAPVTFK